MKWLSLNKRGEAEEMETLTLFDIIIGIAVAAILILSAVSYSGLSGLGRLYVENDMSLMVSTLLSTPGEITARYPISPDYKLQGICLADTEECKKIKVVHTASVFGAFQKETLVFNADIERGIYSTERES
ncbi:MAG: hypothetical protein WC852_03550 [Candidatus Nanoarchaeia archaeon]|jgi:hypothetical protein